MKKSLFHKILKRAAQPLSTSSERKVQKNDGDSTSNKTRPRKTGDTALKQKRTSQK